MNYKEMGRKAYSEWIEQGGYTLTKKQYRGMEEKSRKEFTAGFIQKRTERMGKELGKEHAMSEFMKNFKALADNE